VEDPDYIDLLLEYQQIRKQLAQITQVELSQIVQKNKNDKPSGDQTEGVTKPRATANDKGLEAGQGEGRFTCTCLDLVAHLSYEEQTSDCKTTLSFIMFCSRLLNKCIFL
jgi:hypothetical protein